jgi:hypothetical protein
VLVQLPTTIAVDKWLEVVYIGKLIESSIKRLERLSLGFFLSDSRSIMSGSATEISSESGALLSVTQSSTTINIHSRHNPRPRGFLCLVSAQVLFVV